MPTLTGIDHIDVLGFTSVEALRFWATPDGPLTLENSNGNVHLALFEGKNSRSRTTTQAVSRLRGERPKD